MSRRTIAFFLLALLALAAVSEGLRKGRGAKGGKGKGAGAKGKGKDGKGKGSSAFTVMTLTFGKTTKRQALTAEGVGNLVALTLMSEFPGVAFTILVTEFPTVWVVQVTFENAAEAAQVREAVVNGTNTGLQEIAGLPFQGISFGEEAPVDCEADLALFECGEDQCGLVPLSCGDLFVQCDADCSLLDDACNAGSCVNNLCVSQAVTDGTACSDNDPCTAGDICVAGACSGTPSGTCTIDELAPAPMSVEDVVFGLWYSYFVTKAGVLELVDLSSAGGALQSNQPLPNGALHMTTTTDNDDRANAGLLDQFGGLFGEIAPSLQVQFSFFKADSTPSSTVAFKIEVNSQAAACDGNDCYGTLVWEYYHQPEYGPQNPPQGQWNTVNIDVDSYFWWTGGYGQPNGGGGGAKALSAWLSDFAGQPGFDEAFVQSLQLGVGSYNQNMDVYTDDVRISHSFGGGYSKVFDFEPSAPLA